MQLTITGQHLPITDALKSHIHKKFAKISRHVDRILNVSIVLRVEKKQQIAEANLHLAGVNLFAQAKQEDMYSSIEMLVDKLDRQLLKNKDKLNKHR